MFSYLSSNLFLVFLQRVISAWGRSYMKDNVLNTSYKNKQSAILHKVRPPGTHVIRKLWTNTFSKLGFSWDCDDWIDSTSMSIQGTNWLFDLILKCGPAIKMLDGHKSVLWQVYFPSPKPYGALLPSPKANLFFNAQLSNCGDRLFVSLFINTIGASGSKSRFPSPKS